MKPILHSYCQSAKNTLHTELYYEKLFNRPFNASYPPLSYKHKTIQFPNESPNPFLSLSNMHNDTNIYHPQLLFASNIDLYLRFFRHFFNTIL